MNPLANLWPCVDQILNWPFPETPGELVFVKYGEDSCHGKKSLLFVFAEAQRQCSGGDKPRLIARRKMCKEHREACLDMLERRVVSVVDDCPQVFEGVGAIAGGGFD